MKGQIGCIAVRDVFQRFNLTLLALPEPVQPGVKVGRHWAVRDGVPADAINVPADSASEIVKFTISIPRESCTNAKTKYSSSVVPPDPSVHFYPMAD